MPHLPESNQNTGFREGARLTDWQFKGETGATKPVIEPTGQWDYEYDDNNFKITLTKTIADIIYQ